jgi:hypothetical protein
MPFLTLLFAGVGLSVAPAIAKVSRRLKRHDAMSALSVGDRQGRSGRRADRRHALDFDLAKISFVGCHVLEWTKVLDLRSKITQPLCRFGMHLGTKT